MHHNAFVDVPSASRQRCQPLCSDHNPLLHANAVITSLALERHDWKHGKDKSCSVNVLDCSDILSPACSPSVGAHHLASSLRESQPSRRHPSQPTSMPFPPPAPLKCNKRVGLSPGYFDSVRSKICREKKSKKRTPEFVSPVLTHWVRQSRLSPIDRSLAFYPTPWQCMLCDKWK